ncbi:MAG: homoserine kinase [Candidatus Sedimenticola sp. 20ELBAFRAG]
MSVYTSVSQDELEAFLSGYDAGALVGYQGITDGMENSNYFIACDGAEYVLTLFESKSASELPYFLSLVDFLSARGVPCAVPVTNGNGNCLGELNAKPAVLFRRLPGRWLLSPGQDECEQVGRALGAMHRVGLGFDGRRADDRGLDWMRTSATRLSTHLSEADLRLLQDELNYQECYRKADLPRGVIHADLFRDNVLFSNGRLAGLIDFYTACDGCLLYDLAVTVNDWCVEEDGCVDHSRQEALIRGYSSERQITPGEADAWGVMLRRAALRFWISRLVEFHSQRPGEMALIKDPDEIKRILVSRSMGNVPPLEVGVVPS